VALKDRIINNLAGKTYLNPSTPDSNGTLDGMYNQLDSEFGFTLDAAASDDNAKCKKYYTMEDDALTKDWSNEVVFCAPPNGTSIKRKFIKKAWEESRKGAVVVLFIPVDTSTKIFISDLVKGQIRFIHGRLTFTTHGVERKDSSTYPSMICVFDINRKPDMYMVDRINVQRRLNIEPVLIDTYTGNAQIYLDIPHVLSMRGTEFPITREELAEHLFRESDDLVGKYRVMPKHRYDEAMTSLDEH